MFRVVCLLFFLHFVVAAQNASEKEDEPDREVLLLEANALSGQGKLKEAKDAYYRALKAGANKVICYYNLGNVYYRQENLTQAAKNYRRVIQLAPFFKNAYHNLGKLYFQIQEYSEAFRVFHSFYSFNRSDYSTLILLGDTVREMQNFGEAVRYYEKAKDLDPVQLEAYWALADLYFLLKDDRAALKVLEQGEKVLVDPKPLMRYRAQIFYETGNYKEAANVYSLLLFDLKKNAENEVDEKKKQKIEKDYYNLTLRMADALNEAKFYYLAVYELKALVRKYPRKKQALRLLESLWLREKRENEAFEFFQQFFDQDPSEYYRIMRNLMAVAYNKKKKKLLDDLAKFYEKKGISDEISRLIK